MDIKVKRVEELKDLYEELCQIPSPINARMNIHEGNIVEVVSVWESRSLAMKKSTRHQRVSLVDTQTTRDGEEMMMKVRGTNTVPMANMDSQSIVYSASGNKSVQLISVMDGEEKKFHLKAFDHVLQEEILCSDLSGQKKHGIIHGLGPVERPSPFGCLRFSHGEGHILYCGEKNVKANQYYDVDIEWQNEEKVIEGKVGSKFESIDSWGESNFEVKRPVLCICDISTGSVTVLDELPEGISPSYASWTPDDSGIVFFGLEEKPFKLGRVACNNRRGTLYLYTLSSASLSPLSEHGMGIESPAFSKNGNRLIWMERVVDGPHNAAMRLIEMSWPPPSPLIPRVVVPIVNTCEEGVQWSDEEFPGLYNVASPHRAWSTSGNSVFLATVWGSKTDIVAVNFVTNKVIRLTNKDDSTSGNWTLFDVSDSLILASLSSPNSPSRLFMGRIKEEGDTVEVAWFPLSSPSSSFEHLTDFTWQTVEFVREGVTPYEGFLLLPSNRGMDVPLVLFPHGGPHGCSVIGWQRRDISLLLNSGFAVLSVNYHGSIGFGDQFVRSLPGNCGRMDVDDVHFAVQSVLSSFPMLSHSKVFALGGSHGGFLVSHLAGQFPDFYTAICAHNPVLNMASMYDWTDMTEWCVVEATGTMPSFGKEPSEEQRKQMYDCCPIAHVDKIIRPFLLLIGEKDLRVPPHYRGFIRNIQARGIPCKVLSYPKANHPIGDIEYESDWAINVVRWFEKNM